MIHLWVRASLCDGQVFRTAHRMKCFHFRLLSQKDLFQRPRSRQNYKVTSVNCNSEFKIEMHRGIRAESSQDDKCLFEIGNWKLDAVRLEVPKFQESTVEIEFGIWKLVTASFGLRGFPQMKIQGICVKEQAAIWP